MHNWKYITHVKHRGSLPNSPRQTHHFPVPIKSSKCQCQFPIFFRHPKHFYILCGYSAKCPTWQVTRISGMPNQSESNTCYFGILKRKCIKLMQKIYTSIRSVGTACEWQKNVTKNYHFLQLCHEDQFGNCTLIWSTISNPSWALEARSKRLRKPKFTRPNFFS